MKRSWKWLRKMKIIERDFRVPINTVVRCEKGKQSITFKPVSEIDGLTYQDYISSEEIEAYLQIREEWKRRKVWCRADEIRCHLARHGILVQDSGDTINYMRCFVKLGEDKR